MISAHTPAKINLGLEILRRRPDGYHELNSVFLPVPLFDELTFESTTGEITCVCEAYRFLSDESNLVVRAAKALRDHFSIRDRGVKIDLIKRIPVGAGLGGGSSDAACALNMLNQLWEINAPKSVLHGLARSIGADVPYFLEPSAAIVRGIGDEITPVRWPISMHLLLICPSVHINTAWAYKQVSCDPPRPETPFTTVVPALQTASDLATHFRNDFEPFVFPRYPVLKEIKQRLYDAGAAYAAMSGSGSTMFGVFADAEEAARAAEVFPHTQSHLITLPAP